MRLLFNNADEGGEKNTRASPTPLTLPPALNAIDSKCGNLEDWINALSYECGIVSRKKTKCVK